MSDYTGQDNGTLRVTIREAASRLGVTEAAVRKRIQRGSLNKELGEDGRVYVHIDLSQDMSQPESQVYHEPLIEELRDRVRFLERELDRRSVEAERYQKIVAGLAQANANLTDRLKELDAPTAQPTPPQEPPETSENASDTSEREEPRPTTGHAQEATRRPWWRRIFGE